MFCYVSICWVQGEQFFEKKVETAMKNMSEPILPQSYYLILYFKEWFNFAVDTSLQKRTKIIDLPV